MGLVAFAIREHFVLSAVVDAPIRGDIREYVAYAWNLVHHGVFSHTFPQPEPPIADAYRSPGYPWLLALCMSAYPQGNDWVPLRDWHPLALQVQVLLGTTTALLVVLLARQWLSPSQAILAGLLLALWPHHVAATGALMPEVLFGFTLVAGLYAFAQGWSKRSYGWFGTTGAIFGFAFLVNPLIAVFPLLLALALWLKRERSGAAILLGIYLLPVVAFAVRNANLDDAHSDVPGRATINFVQGSWPEYHDAHRALPSKHPAAVATMDKIVSETRLLNDTPMQGSAMIAERFAQRPWEYAIWYAWRKPNLLWDWNIRLGHGIYVLDVERSPFDTSPILRSWTNTLRALNPMLTLITLGTAIVLLAAGWRRGPWVPAAAIGTLVVYLTLVHMVLQAEPRYAIAYRALEALLLMTALATVARLPGWKRFARGRAPTGPSHVRQNDQR